jgi:hypothetical protein
MSKGTLILHLAAALTVTLGVAACLCLAAKPPLLNLRPTPIDYRWLGEPPSDWIHAPRPLSKRDLMIYPTGWPPLNIPGAGVLTQLIDPETDMLAPPQSAIRRAAAGFPFFALTVTEVAPADSSTAARRDWRVRWLGLGLNTLVLGSPNESLMPTHTCVRHLCEAYGLGRTCVRHSSSR